MITILNLPATGIIITVGLFLLGTWVYRKARTPLLHPVVVAGTGVILLILFTPLDTEAYLKGGSMITFFLGPATVSLAVPLYRKRELLKRHWAIILGSVTMGCITSLGSVLILGRILNIPDDLIYTLMPKSITTPMAIELVAEHGLPALTAVAVIITGIIGAMIGPLVLRVLRIDHPVARGLAMGTAAHAIGTSKALEMGEEEGAIGGLAIGLAGIITVILFPLFLGLL